MAGSVCAHSTVTSVTPTQLEEYGFVFAVTNSVTNGGVWFQVTIAAKPGFQVPEGHAHLCRVTKSKDAYGTSLGIGRWASETGVRLEKGTNAWEAAFLAKKGLLQDPDISFVFVVEDKKGPAADFYVVKLRDFIKRPDS